MYTVKCRCFKRKLTIIQKYEWYGLHEKFSQVSVAHVAAHIIINYTLIQLPTNANFTTITKYVDEIWENIDR